MEKWECNSALSSGEKIDEHLLKIEMDSTTVFTWLDANTSSREVKGVFVSLLRSLLGAELGQVPFSNQFVQNLSATFRCPSCT